MAVTKTEGGKEYPAEAYAYVPNAKEPSTWKLRLWQTPQTKMTAAQVGRAMAALGKGFRGNKVEIPAADMPAVMTKMRAAWKSMHPDAKPADMPAMMKEAATTELNQIGDLVADAVRDKLQAACAPGQMCNYCCIEALFPDRVIIEQDGRYWSYPYSIDDSNQVTLGDAQEVLESFEPVGKASAMKEARTLDIDTVATAFIEAADKEGKAWDAVIIRAGTSMNGVYYPDAVLREAAPLFEGARVFAKPDVEHLRGESKDVNKLAGWFSGVKFVEGKSPDTGYLGGRYNFAAGASSLRETVTDAWVRGKRDLVGFSIDAIGRAKNALRGAAGKGAKRIATAITKVNSVDLIVEPSAGGALVRLAEAADDHEEHDPMKQRMLATIQAKAPAIFAKIDPAKITDEELETRYAEALAPAQAAGGVTAEQLSAQMSEQIRMVESRAYLRTALATSKLPEHAQERVRADFGKRERFAEADVDTAIKAERVYVARFTESGKVKLDDKGELIEVEDRSVKIAGMLDAFFDPKHKDHRSVQSFKECYIEVTGDKRVTGRLEHMDRTRLAESLGAAFRESLDSTSFGNVLGDSITRRMVAEYNMQSQYDAWRQIASVVPVSDFRTQDRTMFGGYGDLPAVLQGDPYAALGSPTDLQATYAVTKRGGTEDVTLEMIKNDDVGAIRRIPVKLARSAKRTLGKFVFDFVRTNPVIYDGINFFHANHSNLGSTALAAAELGVARRAMMKQTELNSGDVMSIPPKSLLVPIDLQEAAWNIFQRGTNLDKTFIETMILSIIPVWYWTDATDWAIAADPNDLPGIEVGFLDGAEEPSLFVQDMPNVGSMFSNDKLTYKIRHIYGGNVLPGGEKAFYKEVVAN